MNRALVGTGRLIRFILRRDRFLLPGWAVWLAIVPLAATSGFKALYPTQEALNTAAQDLDTNPAFRAMFGPVYGTSIGSLVAWRASIILVVIGVLSALTVIRHTRVEEETGRRELVGSTVIGRHAPLTAAFVVAALTDVGVGVLIALGIAAQGVPMAGSIALGVQMAAAGVLFAAIGTLAAQLTSTAGGARGIALSVIGLAYVIRAAGDAGDAGWLSWLSPIGWLQRVRPFGGEQWWVLLPALALVAAVGAAAFRIAARRDIGSGVFPSRLGPATAPARLSTPLGLAWRIHRGILYGWTAGLFVLGGIYGGVADGVGKLIEGNEQMQEIFARIGGDAAFIIDIYLASVMSILALLTAAYAIQAALRMRIEEEGLRAEPVLATAAPRIRWICAHYVFAFGGPVVVLAATGLSVGVTYGLVTGDIAGQVPRALGAALVQLPAVWVLAGITVALFGLVPRLTSGGWVAYGAVVFILFLGAILRLGQWFMDLSPFTHIPKLPGGAMLVTPLLILGATSVALGAAGVAGFRQRDIG